MHSINTSIPFSWDFDQDNPIELGITLKSTKKDFKLSAQIAAFPFSSRYTSNTTSYYDSSVNEYTFSERPKYQLVAGDSFSTKLHSTQYQGYGFRVGFVKDLQFINIPLHTNVYFGLFARKSDYYFSKLQTKYDTGRQGSPQITPSYYIDFTNTDYFSDERWTLLPKIGTSVSIVLTANDRLSVVPRLNLNLTLDHIYRYQADGLYNELS